MLTSIIGSPSTTNARLAASNTAIEAFKASNAEDSQQTQSDLRRQVGEFVGTIFYGTLFRQMQQSKIKGKFFHGGRGEEVFQSQLGMALATRIGQSPDDPIAGRIYQAIRRQVRPDISSKINRTILPTIRDEQGVI